jgi:Flp pilus assembly protein CpaB
MRASGNCPSGPTTASAVIAIARDQVERLGARWRPMVRSRPLRRATRRRLVGLTLVAVAGLGVADVVSDAEAARSAWGPGLTVVVADRDLAAGALVGTGDLLTRRLPAGVVPDGAVTTTETAVGRRVRNAVRRGEVLVDVRLAEPGAGSTAALLSEGTVAVGATVTTHGPALAPGDVVDVWAPAEPAARRVATAAVVLTVGATDDLAGGRGVTLAVGEADVPGTTTASLSGPVALVVVPWASPSGS